MQNSNFIIRRYCADLKSIWDDTVRKVRQQSFLFLRDFMDYHKDRFVDISLIVFDKHHKAIALFPANISNNDSAHIESHGGLTYGGLLLIDMVTTKMTDEIFHDIIELYKSLGFSSLLYKPVPHIYHIQPVEEDLYALFRHKALLETRAVSSVINIENIIPFSTLRKRKVKKADRLFRYMEDKTPTAIGDFWRILNDVLQERHNTKPVHSLVELQYIVSKFPNEIRLFVARKNTNSGSQDQVVAGCVLFMMPRVIHVQYIASNEEGRESGALDGLFSYLISLIRDTHTEKLYFDFGISTEKQGLYLNEGLIFQKEGYGGRAICYDAYRLNLK